MNRGESKYESKYESKSAISSTRLPWAQDNAAKYSDLGLKSTQKSGFLTPTRAPGETKRAPQSTRNEAPPFPTASASHGAFPSASHVTFPLPSFSSHSATDESFSQSPIMSPTTDKKFASRSNSNIGYSNSKQDTVTNTSTISTVSHKKPRTRDVTVFGFPPEKMHVVLSRLANYGEYVRQDSSSRGNWVHLRFSNPLDAEMCLAENGKIIDGEIMIGIMAGFHPAEDSTTTPNATERLLLGSSLALDTSRGPVDPAILSSITKPKLTDDLLYLQGHSGTSARFFDSIWYIVSTILFGLGLAYTDTNTPTVLSVVGGEREGGGTGERVGVGGGSGGGSDSVVGPVGRSKADMVDRMKTDYPYSLRPRTDPCSKFMQHAFNW